MKPFVLILLMLLTILLTVAVMGAIFYLLVKRFFDNQQKERLLEIKMQEKKENLSIVSPIRLQAYERMALFLERISPNSLVMRCYQPGMDLKLLQGVMTKSIRDEWEHNLSQQVYISSAAWSLVRDAKEQMINLVNSSAASMAADADPMSLAGAIFTNVAKNNVPTDKALEYLKNEVRQSFE